MLPPLMKGKGAVETSTNRRLSTDLWRRVAQLFLLTSCSVLVFYAAVDKQVQKGGHGLPLHVEKAIKKCETKDRRAGPPPDFHDRERSDRFQPGTPPVLIRDARIWTGARRGTETVSGDILLKDGVIAAVITLDWDTPARLEDPVIRTALQDIQLEVIDAKGRWVTPGYIKCCLSVAYSLVLMFILGLSIFTPISAFTLHRVWQAQPTVTP